MISIQEFQCCLNVYLWNTIWHFKQIQSYGLSQTDAFKNVLTQCSTLILAYYIRHCQKHFQHSIILYHSFPIAGYTFHNSKSKIMIISLDFFRWAGGIFLQSEINNIITLTERVPEELRDGIPRAPQNQTTGTGWLKFYAKTSETKGVRSSGIKINSGETHHCLKTQCTVLIDW